MRVHVRGEGPLDVAVGTRLVQAAGFATASAIAEGGSAALDRRLRAYRQSTTATPWLILRDLDQAACVPALLADLAVPPADAFLLRFPVREVEAWLLADAASIATFLGVPEGTVPRDPDALADPKRALVDLARRARKDLRAALVPVDATRPTGPAYTATVSAFAATGWEPERAGRRSPSLRRCWEALLRLRTGKRG